MLDRGVRGPGPYKAIISSADPRSHSLERDRVVRRMKIELLAAETDAHDGPFSGAPFLQIDRLGAQHPYIEGDRFFDVSNRHRDMIDFYFHGVPANPAATTAALLRPMMRERPRRSPARCPPFESQPPRPRPVPGWSAANCGAHPPSRRARDHPSRPR